MKKLYINITSRCNTDCPFCCMYSNSKKETEMDFTTFKQIINSCNDDFILQIEGGEPLVVDSLYRFIGYACQFERCKGIIIDTNGLSIKYHIDKLIANQKIFKIPFTVKISVNYWLLRVNKNHLQDIKHCIEKIENIDGFKIFLNTRKRFNDDWIDEKIEELGLSNISKSFLFQSYGRLTNSIYPALNINDNHDWAIYAADGKCFGKDLIARSRYERNLP